jgi:hypothetical protein
MSTSSEPDFGEDPGTTPIEDGHGDREAGADELPAPDVEQASVLRVPTFSLLACLLGWLSAWGAIAVATSILDRSDVPLGFNLGIASGGPGDDGFWAGVWLLLVSLGGFLVGGYNTARVARANGTRHAIVMFLIAMGATLADALVEWSRSGDQGVIRRIPGVPFWAETGLADHGETLLVLALFAGAALVGSLLGGALGQGVNRADRTDDAIVQRTT